MFAALGMLFLTVSQIRCGSPSPAPAPAPFWGVPGPVLVYQRPIEAMVDVTNDLGVAVLQDYAYTRSNFAFSPYGVASVLVVLYEGARGESARQIHNTLRLPWNRDITRIGFRDIHRHLRSYFSHEGYLSGLTLNKNHTSLLLEYRRVLRFYGYDVGMGGENFPPTTTKKPSATTTSTTTTTTTTAPITEPMTSETSTEATTMDPRNMVTDEVTTTEAITRTTALSQGETTTEDNSPQTTTTMKTTQDVTPTTTTEYLPTTTNMEPATDSNTPSTTTTTLKTTEDIIPPTTTTKSTTEDIIPSPTTTTTTVRTTEDIIPSTTTKSTTEEIIPSTTTTVKTTEDIIPSTSRTTEDIIPSTATTRKSTSEEGFTLITLTIPRETTPKPSEEPVNDQTNALPTQDEQPTTSPDKTSTAVLGESPPESTSKEMPEESMEPAEESTPTGASDETESQENPTASAELPQASNAPSTTSEDTQQTSTTSSSSVMDEEPMDKPDETLVETIMPMVPTDKPPEITTEPEAELITVPDKSTGSAESSADTMAPTQDSTNLATGENSDTSISTESESSTALSDTENTGADEITTDITTQTTMAGEELTESGSDIIETSVKAGTPIPLVFNQTRSYSNRSKRSLADAIVVFPDISLQLQNGMFDSQVARGYELYTQLPKRPFLVDGVAEELVPVMSYTAVFPFAYIKRLHAQALEFPLDDERYKLLLLLPVERRGLRQLIYDLSSCPLREIYQALRPTRVQAIIPSFMVEGFVILTPTLQQLGIWDVFDPRRADLSGMSNDPDLYVRNIEQAVTVVIRNYVKILDIQTRTMAARATIERFVVTHPFLYFVMDTDTHVALMAGKIVDPLNSRIY